MGIDELLQRFRDHLTATGKSLHTVVAYTRDLRLFARWFEVTNDKSLSPQGITPIDLRQYRSHLLTVKGRRPATANRKLASLSAFCSWAREEGLIPANPAQGIGQVEEVRPAPKWLDRRGQYALLRAVQERGRKRDVALITLMLHTGLRVSEVAQLRVGDLKISTRKGPVLVRGGKGNKDLTVPLNADARRALREYLKVRPNVEDDHLFIGQRSPSLTPSAIWRVVKKYGRRAGPEISPHTLRHTFGTRLVRRKGVDLVTVAAMMGHESLETTAIYTEPSENDMADAVETLSAE